MAMDVLVPQMGESVLEGTILEWKVKVGDKVKLNQPLVELMTDKVNVEIPAEAEGVIVEILAREGEVVPVGKKVAVIDDGKGEVKPSTPKSEEPKDEVKPPEPTAAKSVPVAPVPATKPAPRATGPIERAKMSPKVKMMIREYNLDLSRIIPTGLEGRVTVEDIERAVADRSSSAGFTPGPIPAPPVMPSTLSVAAKDAPTEAKPAVPLVKVDIPRFEPLPEVQRVTREPLVGVRKMISDHMVKSVQTSPHVTTFEDLDLTELVNYRDEIKGNFKRTYGANITFMPFIIKAVCLGLHEFPKINASMTDSEIIFKHFYNIGIAVARDEGLIVPVIKDADKKTLVELAVELAELGDKARTNRLTPDDVSDGTFTLTNAGMFGATASTPIINQPQVAILGIHAIVKKPWVVDGEIKVRDISTFGLSFDHRLIDGHEAVQFLHRVHEYLSDPRKMLLSLR
ncbi:MAG TPA: dihydrolipoamide acetyltransferase family protein [candidate division Zixibacteria bacterium]|nr:dihydrolipoamide acetyltransferase family protein [candidate division Zixibacteria bacterium]